MSESEHILRVVPRLTEGDHVRRSRWPSRRRCCSRGLPRSVPVFLSKVRSGLAPAASGSESDRRSAMRESIRHFVPYSGAGFSSVRRDGVAVGGGEGELAVVGRLGRERRRRRGVRARLSSKLHRDARRRPSRSTGPALEVDAVDLEHGGRAEAVAAVVAADLAVVGDLQVRAGGGARSVLPSTVRLSTFQWTPVTEAVVVGPSRRRRCRSRRPSRCRRPRASGSARPGPGR